MKLSLKFLSMLSALLLVAACETPSDSNNSAVTDGKTGENLVNPETGENMTPEEAELRNSVGDRVFFAYDSSVLTSEGQATLQRQSAFASKYANLNFVIEGHCDERGTREYNIALGERRANAVKTYLTSVGVDSSRVSVVSYGKERPAVVGSNDEAWAQNRRGVTTIAK